MSDVVFEPIGHIESMNTDPARTPNQASESDGTARVVIKDRFIDGLLGLERYEFVWLVTSLHDQPDDRPLQLVPRATAATGEVQGVFASRAPVRPNAIGLSLVGLLEVEGNELTVSGVDLLDGTPVLDIKPWFEDCDLPPGRSS
jgi:tRNA-Thr(GGU) m(6)t(6)A37 methyltransferase TsaA